MKLSEAQKLLKRYCRHYEKWFCGPAEIYTTGRDTNPRFDRRLEIYLDLKPDAVNIQKIASLLKLLDQLGKPIKFNWSLPPARERF